MGIKDEVAYLIRQSVVDMENDKDTSDINADKINSLYLNTIKAERIKKAKKLFGEFANLNII